MTESKKINVVDISDRIEKRQNKELSDSFCEHIGIPQDELKGLIETTMGVGITDDDFSEAIQSMQERAVLYESYMKIKEKQDIERGIDPQYCCCAVCPSHVASEREVERDTYTPTGEYTGTVIESEGRQDYCSTNMAQDCSYRMTDGPPNSISYNEKHLPSHKEALNILSRNGLLSGDDFGHYNGTDFAFHKNVSKLWRAFAELVGKVSGKDWSEPSEKSHAIDTAKAYFGNRMGINGDVEWKLIEDDVKHKLDYLLTTVDPQTNTSDSYDSVYDGILNHMRGLYLSNVMAKGKE